MKVGIVFDLDGTLFNSLKGVFRSVNRMRQKNNLPTLSDVEIAQHAPKGTERMVRRCFKELKTTRRTNDLVKEYKKYSKEILQQSLGDSGIYPEVEPTLRRLRAIENVRLGICTTKLTAHAERFVYEAIQEFRFDAILGPDRVAERKPHPAHLKEILDWMDCSPEQSWFVGDSEEDREFAKSSGVRFLAAMYGFGGVQPEDPNQALRCFSDILVRIPLKQAA